MCIRDSLWLMGQDDQSVGRRLAVSAFAMPPVLASDTLLACFSGTLELKATKESAHSGLIFSVAFSPDSKSIVSGAADKTIKVWDAGQPFHFLPYSSQSLPLLAFTQVHWSSRRLKRMRTPTQTYLGTLASNQWRILLMAPRLCPLAREARSKSGTQVLAFANCHAACPRL